jgi:hypothetical protein
MNTFSLSWLKSQIAPTRPLARLDRRELLNFKKALPNVTRPTDLGEACFLLGIQYAVNLLETGWAHEEVSP